jgi:hypothetical protein
MNESYKVNKAEKLLRRMRQIIFDLDDNREKKARRIIAKCKEWASPTWERESMARVSAKMMNYHM